MGASKPLFAEERKEQIIKMVNEKEKIYVPEMSRIFNVSTATIRNDLNELEKSGRLVRTHGGAISIQNSGLELNTEQKKVKNSNSKLLIATQALEFIENGDIILIDTGTTTYQLATLLKEKRNITIVTNDIEIALQLEEVTGLNVILVGGMLRKGFHCTLGPFANKILSEISVDKAFIATNGIDTETGLYTPDTNQAAIKECMISCAREKYLLCDSSKFGRKSFSKFADVSDFDFIITDKQIEEEEYEKLSRYTKVITV
ncbi:MAG: DeoR/GlpR family DNA-binding transcription regulator [Vallitalea sp.]|jgi:DeoR family fructose operon transcriptional repressor|nr:DeoR/GlpR family DNA-binding transcription regulator [Vallitalea sp.]